MPTCDWLACSLLFLCTWTPHRPLSLPRTCCGWLCSALALFKGTEKGQGLPYCHSYFFPDLGRHLYDHMTLPDDLLERDPPALVWLGKPHSYSDQSRCPRGKAHCPALPPLAFTARVGLLTPLSCPQPQFGPRSSAFRDYWARVLIKWDSASFFSSPPAGLNSISPKFIC